MVKVEKDAETNGVTVIFDDETLQGQQFGVTLDDGLGLKLMADLCQFYIGKGYRFDEALQTVQPKRSIWARLFGAKL